HIGCLFIRKQLLEDNNLFFDEDLRLGEDLDFIYRLLITCDMYAVPYYMYKHNYRENSLMNSCRTITHYRHESFAHERIYSSVMQLYKGNRKEEIHTLLSKNRTYHKTRYLWNVLLNGDFELLNQLVESNEKELKDCNLLGKRDKRRAKILASKNYILWRMVRLVNRKKNKR
ncbi:glycosyltransferase family 2 protein, partial [Escherichia coli]|nr:glycosyltransferase family 2 protein [Escherichia coli]